MGIATIAGLALTAAGTATSIAAAKNTQRRMNDIVRDQIAAAEGFQQQATPEFQRSLGASGAEATKRALSVGEQEALRGYQDIAGIPTTAPSPILSNAIIDAQTQARIGQSQQSQAILQGYNNATLQQILANQRAQQNLGVISGLAGSRSAITPFLLQGEQQRGQNMASVGSLLGTAGSLAGVYGQLYPYLQQPGQQPPVGRPGDRRE